MFNTINYLLYDKSKTELDADLIQEFNPFMTTRTFSYYNSGMYCNYINQTLNQFGNVFTTKEDQFKFFDTVIPKLKKRKNEYIKKSKPEPVAKDNSPIPEFMSRRELDMIKKFYK